jgi:hypothetical protein
MEIPRHARVSGERLRLQAIVCRSCGHRLIGAREACDACGAVDVEPLRLSGNGAVWSFAWVADAPVGFEAQAPYPVAIIELDEGVRVTAALTDVEPGDVRIGLRVEVVTRRLSVGGADGLIVYGYKFRPISFESRGADG